jgi:cytochrome P450
LEVHNSSFTDPFRDMFSAGSETAATTMTWGMAEMIKNPTVMKKAQAEVVFNRNGKADETAMNEMKYLKVVVKETLRLHPPAPLLVPRESTQRGVKLMGMKFLSKLK